MFEPNVPSWWLAVSRGKSGNGLFIRRPGGKKKFGQVPKNPTPNTRSFGVFYCKVIATTLLGAKERRQMKPFTTTGDCQMVPFSYDSNGFEDAQCAVLELTGTVKPDDTNYGFISRVSILPIRRRMHLEFSPSTKLAFSPP